MSRTADFAIQGFLYQFIITLQRILQSSNDEVITIEGIVEDIDIQTPLGFEAIQCKYHESKAKFVLSDIYKPVLQMLNHFKNNETAGVKYVLHAHFPSEKVGTKRNILITELEQILSSKADIYKKLISDLNGFKNLEGFAKQFEIVFGASLSDTKNAVIFALAQEGFTTEDANDLFFPNAVYDISEYSIKHDSLERKITKKSFLEKLQTTKKTAINRWTKELLSNEKLLLIRRRQLNNILNVNSKLRAIVIKGNYINDFESKTHQLIIDFLHKYNSKPRLNICPIICLDCEESLINDIWTKLKSKKIKVLRGIEAGIFDVNSFLRNPIKSNKDVLEFDVKICNFKTDFKEILDKSVLDDIIIISDSKNVIADDVQDVNKEYLNTPNINEIKYQLSLTKSL